MLLLAGAGLAIAMALLIFGGRWGQRGLLVAATILVAIVVASLIFFLNFFSAEQLVAGYVNEVVTAFGLSPLLTKVITAAIVIPFVASVGWTISLHQRRRQIGRAGIAALAVIYFSGIWLATRDQKVTRTGEALQCYIVTEQGVEWRDIQYRGMDPDTGRPCEPVEPQLIPTLARLDRLLRDGKSLASIDPQGRFFSAIGDPIIWFQRGESGEFEFFDAPGFHPTTGRRLEPVTEAVVETWRQYEAAKTEAAQRQAESDRLAKEDAARLEREREEAAAAAETAKNAREAELARLAEEAARAEEAERLERNRRAEEAARQQEAVRREQDRLEHLRKMIVPGVTGDAETTTGIVIVPTRSDDALDSLAASLLSERLPAAAIATQRVLPSLFASAFVSDGHFATTFSGDLTVLQEAGAFQRVGQMLLGVVDAECGQPSSQGVTSCQVAFSYRVVRSEGVIEAGQLTEVGPAFSSDAAVRRSVELLVERKGELIKKLMGGLG